MTSAAWREEPIAKNHDRKSFDCGAADLNTFLHRHARQAHERGGAKTYLAVSLSDPHAVLGFYSIAPGSLAYADMPETVRRQLARHDVPVFRLARLATHVSVQGGGLGGQLFLAAGRRCLLAAQNIGGVGLLIDAKGGRPADWYASYGALRLQDRPLTLIMPFATIEAALTSAGDPKL